MGYKVKVTRMVEYDELTKDERIHFASTTEDKELLYLLSRDQLPEVRAKLVHNTNVSEFFIYERLINDPSEEVKSALRARYKNLYLWSNHWIISHFSMILFGKLSTFDKIEHRQALAALIYLSLITGEVGLGPDNGEFFRGGEYYPYSIHLELAMMVTSNVYRILPYKIEELKYGFSDEAQQKMDDLWKNINKEKPHDISLEKWVSIIATIHFAIHSMNSSCFKNGDKYEQLAYEFVIRHFK